MTKKRIMLLCTLAEGAVLFLLVALFVAEAISTTAFFALIVVMSVISSVVILNILKHYQE